MGKKARLKKERKRIKKLDGVAPSEVTIDQVVRAIVMDGASVPLAKLYLSKGEDIDALSNLNASMLHVACGTGNLELVQYLLEQGANPDRRGIRGNGALHVAVESDSPDVVRALLAAGAQMDSQNDDGLTAMQKAVQHGHAKAVAALGEAGADYKTWPDDEIGTFSLLQIAVTNSHPETVKALAKLGANPEIGLDDMLPLSFAVQASSTETVRALLSSGADFSAINEKGHTALNDAANGLHLGAVKALLEAGADPNQADDRGSLPLRIAVESGYLETIRVLLDAGAKINAIEDTGKITALKWAARLAAPEIVQMLLERGADSSLDGGDGMSPMCMVAASPTSYGFNGPKEMLEKHGEYDQICAARKKVRRTAHSKPKETVRALVKAGASVDQVDHKGRTPLYRAVSIGRATLDELSIVERMMGRSDISGDMDTGYNAARRQIRKVVEAFLENGADIELRCGEENQTPLNKAARSSVAEAVKALVKAGAELEAANAGGYTPLHEAAAEGEVESVRILVAAGADIKAKTPDGETPAELATQTGRDNVDEVLRELAPAGG